MSKREVSIPDQSCDECGRAANSIKRVYKEHRYCGTCYARIFKRLLCPGCKGFARLPKHEPEAVCQRCEVNKPCIRCQKVGYSIGKITVYGPVCTSCAPYFLAPLSCERCNEITTQLTTVTRLGGDLKLCRKCARSDFKTCAACRRHRLCFTDKSGRHICSICRDLGSISCGTCGGTMPAGRGKQCEECYWSLLVERRAKINVEMLSQKGTRQSFLDFVMWLVTEIGAKKAAQSQSRYVDFFYKIDQQWGGIPAYEQLLTHFGAEGLRRFRLATKWMTSLGLISVNHELKEADSNSRAIGKLLSTFDSKSAPGRLLASYYLALLKKSEAGKTSLKSICLSLRPAARLLECSVAMEVMPPTQAVLQRYLSGALGQRAALSGFVGHLNESYNQELRMPKAGSPSLAQHRLKLEQKLLSALRDQASRSFQKRWLTLGMAYFHDIPIAISSRISVCDIKLEDGGGLTVTWQGHQYFLPSPSSVIYQG